MEFARNTRHSVFLFSVIVLLVAEIGCSSKQPRGGAREVTSLGGAGTGVSEVELQQDIQRFASEFNERVIQAMTPLAESEDLRIRDVAPRQLLLYASSAIDIATGPSPEVNLLDMMFFVRLNRLVIRDTWIPDVYGSAGRPLLRAFETSEASLWQMAGKVVSPAGRKKMAQLVDDWRRQNPEQTRVETLRSSVFSQFAGRAAQRQAQEVGGLLASVHSATAAADSAILFAERSLYLAQRMPFLLRLQVRVAAGDVTTEVLSRAATAETLLARTTPLLRDATELAQETVRVASEGRSLVAAIDHVLPERAERRPERILEMIHGVDESLNTAERIVVRLESLLNISREVVRRPTSIDESVPGPLGELDRVVRRWVLYLFLLGAGWIACGWGGYYIAKRRLAKSRPL